MTLDVSPLFHTALTLFAWSLPLLILVSLMRSTSGKGWSGEFLVRLAGKLLLNKATYQWRDNVTLPTADGTTQIDHIIVSPYGVFVIETKHMRGRIFGREGQGQWTQQLGRQSFPFQNPLRQNYKHVVTLQALLGLPPESLHSLVVFVGNCRLRTELPPSITKGLGFIAHIRSFRTRLLSDADIERVLQRIDTVRLAPTLATHRAHVRNLREHSNRQANAEECPRCGRTLVLRTVRSGLRAGEQFWGCPSFPRCRGTRPLTSGGD